MNRVTPTPLPPTPKFIDRIEYGLQWLASWLIIYSPTHPCATGSFTELLTGLLLLTSIVGIAILLNLLGIHW
jgi:hypothetical protein